MEKFLVLSDSHGNLDLLNRVLEREVDYSAIFHLGDNYEDLEKCIDISNLRLFRVPGVFHKGYRDKSLPTIITCKSNGWSILLVHYLSDALAKAQDADIYLHGHTHKPEIFQKFGKIFFNPGHLKQLRHRGYQATYGILEIDEKKSNFFVKDLQYNVIYNKIFNR